MCVSMCEREKEIVGERECVCVCVCVCLMGVSNRVI